MFGSGILGSVKTTLRQDGLLILLWKVVVRLVEPWAVLGGELCVRRDLGPPVELRQARVPVRVARAGMADAEAVSSVEHGGAEPTLPATPREIERLRMRKQALAAFRRDIGNGERCFVAYADGRIVHVNWTHMRLVYPSFGPPIPLRPHEVLTTNAYTPPDWRGKAIHEAVLSAMLAAARADGRSVAYTITDLYNIRSRHGLRRVGGWRVCGLTLYLKPWRHGHVRALWIGRPEGPFTVPQRALWRTRIAAGLVVCFARIETEGALA